MAEITETLTIEDGQADSNVLSVMGNYPVTSFLILAPMTLTEVINIQIAEKLGGTFRTLRSNGVVIALGAGMADQITLCNGAVMRLHSTTTLTGGDRVFTLLGHPRI